MIKAGPGMMAEQGICVGEVKPFRSVIETPQRACIDNEAKTLRASCLCGWKLRLCLHTNSALLRALRRELFIITSSSQD